MTGFNGMTLTAKNEVINTAMAHLGEPGFSAIDTDPPGAALAKVLGQLDGRAGVEQFALSRHPWLCALSYTTLAPAVSPPTNWKWKNLFILPDTFVKMWVVDGDDVPFEVGTEVISSAVKKVVRCDEAALRIAFSERKAWEAYSPDLCNYMALLLAARTAGPLKNDYDGAARLTRQADEALQMAMGGEAGQYLEPEVMFASGFAALRASAA
jgi:hypothetical protein